MSGAFGGSPRLVQIAVIVNDLEAAVQRYARIFGDGHTAIKASPPAGIARMEYRGRPSDAGVRMAFFDVGNGVRLELLQPADDKPSVWKEHLDRFGEGVHHVGFEVEDMTQVKRNFADAGHQTIQAGEYVGGRYAYVATKDRIAFTVELLENTKESQ
jgi:catechol 2,3-dioxygenase-like lactoylglutathione lyase family enzyme